MSTLFPKRRVQGHTGRTSATSRSANILAQTFLAVKLTKECCSPLALVQGAPLTSVRAMQSRLYATVRHGKFAFGAWSPALLQNDDFRRDLEVAWQNPMFQWCVYAFVASLALYLLIEVVSWILEPPEAEGPQSVPASSSAQGVPPSVTRIPSMDFPQGLEKHLNQAVVSPFSGELTDLGPLFTEAFGSFEERKRTFLEWLRGLDLETEHLEQKFAASEKALGFVRQRTELIEGMRAMTLAAASLQHVEFEKHLTRFRAYVDHLKLEAERVQLENDIARERALAGSRLLASQLEEQKRQDELQKELKAAKRTGAIRSGIAKHRGHIKAVARAEQQLIAGFHKHVRELFQIEGLPPEQMAGYIRSALKTFHQDVTALPKDIRDFLARVEADSHA